MPVVLTLILGLAVGACEGEEPAPMTTAAEATADVGDESSGGSASDSTAGEEGTLDARPGPGDDDTTDAGGETYGGPGWESSGTMDFTSTTTSGDDASDSSSSGGTTQGTTQGTTDDTTTDAGGETYGGPDWSTGSTG